MEPVSAEYTQRKEYDEALNQPQQEVGSLQWLALKTRPVIACITAICASVQSKNHEWAYNIAMEVWKYIHDTHDISMYIIPNAVATVEYG